MTLPPLLRPCFPQEHCTIAKMKTQVSTALKAETLNAALILVDPFVGHQNKTQQTRTEWETKKSDRDFLRWSESLISFPPPPPFGPAGNRPKSLHLGHPDPHESRSSEALFRIRRPSERLWSSLETDLETFNRVWDLVTENGISSRNCPIFQILFKTWLPKNGYYWTKLTPLILRPL